MKKLQIVSFVILMLSVILWTAGRMLSPPARLDGPGQRRGHAHRHGPAGVFQRPAKD